ncbi:MAG: MarR family transcriptional regulator [Hyphomicrobiales bacterium]
MAVSMKPSITDTDGALKIEDQLCFALYSTSRAITKQYAIILSELGITYPQYLALLVLWQEDGLLVQDIATQLELDSATVTPLVQRLEKMCLVCRQRSKIDERKVHVYLTDDGKALFQKALTVPHQLTCRTGIDEETAKRLIAQTSAIKGFILQNN